MPPPGRQRKGTGPPRVPRQPALANLVNTARGARWQSEHMSDSLSVRGVGPLDRDRSHALFGQTIAYVAVTAGVFALGSYLGRSLSEGWAIVWFIVAFTCLISMNFTVRRSVALSVGLLLGVGLALGLAMATRARLLREHEPAGTLAGRRGDRPVHRRVRDRWLRDPAGSVGTRAAELLGAGRAHPVRYRADSCAHPARFVFLFFLRIFSRD